MAFVPFFFLILSKPHLILGNSKSRSTGPTQLIFYYVVQILPWLPLPERVFSDGSSTADSGYHSSITEKETREVCQKRLGPKSGSLGNFSNVSAHIFIFTFIFYFYCILFSTYALLKIEKNDISAM